MKFDNIIATLLLGVVSITSLMPSLVLFSLPSRGNYRLEFVIILAMLAAYLVIAIPVGYILGRMVEKDYHNFRAAAVLMAATFIVGFAYFLIGRPRMPLERVFFEHIALTAATWLVVTPIAWAIWSGKASK